MLEGLVEGKKKRMVSGLVQRWKPEVLMLQETKLVSFDNSLVRSLGGVLVV